MSLRTPPRPSLLDKGREPGRSLRYGLIALGAVVLLIAGAVLLALGGDDRSEEGAVQPQLTLPAAAPTTSTPDPLEPTRAAVLTAWRGYWTAYDEAASRADPDWPGLREYMTGRALTDVQLYMTGLRRNGLVERGGLELRPRVVAIEGTTATVWDCVTDDGHQYDQSGRMVDKPGAVTRGAEAKLVLEGGKWKVSERPSTRPEACPA